MSFMFSISSLGFVARFILAFIIIAFLYSKDKTDPHLRKGFTVLIVLGAIALALGVIFMLIFFVAGGAAFLGNALTNFRFHF